MEMITISQLADVSGWPASRIRRLIKTRKLTHLRMNGLTLLPADAIDEFMRVNLVKPEVGNEG
jgi:excisionase family DNA binding protein